jgi:hypothetical protein
MKSPQIVRVLNEDWEPTIGILDIASIAQAIVVEAEPEKRIPKHVNIVCQLTHCTTILKVDVPFEKVCAWIGIKPEVMS